MRCKWAHAILSSVFALFLAISTAPLAKADCTFNVYPSSLALVSFDGTFTYLASGSISALVNQNGCLIVEDGAATYSPLGGFPVTPLFTPLDTWVFFDDGSPLPFEPFFTVGTVAFASFNPFDGTGSVGNNYVTLLIIPT